MKDLFPLQTHEGLQTIDSRLVAQSLGVDHSQWLRNLIMRHRQTIENQFGILFIENKKEKSTNGRPVKFALLTEDQAIFIATLSRNTDRVVQFKAKLVKSFAAARRQVSQRPMQEIEHLKYQVRNLQSEMELMRLKHKAAMSELKFTMLCETRYVATGNPFYRQLGAVMGN